MGPALTPPPLPTRRTLVSVWLAAAVGFAVLLGLASVARSPLADPDPARQRPGVLDLGGLPAGAPAVGPDVPRPGHRAVVFFARPGGAPTLCAALAARRFPQDVDLAVVVSGPAEGCQPDIMVVADPTGALVARFGLDVPADGGPPIGYAVVDDRQRIRYRTLDPQAAAHLGEVATILGATG